MGKEKDDLHHSIRHLKKSINALANLINAVDGKVDVVYEKLKLEDKRKQRRGEERFRDCIYLEDGYCVEPAHVVDPETANVSTVKKKGQYYPRVTWVDCEICDRFCLLK